MLIERNEGTAARRRVPMRLFTSDGTSPDTGATGDAAYMGVNSAGTIALDNTLTEIHAAHGMYYVELTQSNTSVLGTHPIYHVAGDFGQHVANVDIVNFNPYSSFSNIAAGAYSGVTLGINDIDPSALSAVADALLSRSIAGSEQTTVRNVTNSLRFLRNRVWAQNSVLTVYQEDDSTSAWTASITTVGDPSGVAQVNPSP
jgi:hypothetical protein